MSTVEADQIGVHATGLLAVVSGIMVVGVTIVQRMICMTNLHHHTQTFVVVMVGPNREDDEQNHRKAH